MPARLAAMPRMPVEPVCGSATRVAERLTRSVVIRTGTGFGLATPRKLIIPNVRGTIGAWAADGVSTATARAAGAVALTVGVPAEAGSAREATMAPEMTITAEALLAGLAEREIAAERDDAALEGLGARWRPLSWLDTVIETSPDAYEVSCRVRVGDCTRPSRWRIDRGRPPPRGLHPKERLSTSQIWVPRSCQADVVSLDCGDRTRRTASRTPSGETKRNHRTHGTFICHICITANPATDQEQRKAGPRPAHRQTREGRRPRATRPLLPPRRLRARQRSRFPPGERVRADLASDQPGSGGSTLRARPGPARLSGAPSRRWTLGQPARRGWSLLDGSPRSAVPPTRCVPASGCHSGSPHARPSSSRS